MMKWTKLAFRNILRNRRRSFVTIVAVGVGFAAISLYYGYIHNVYDGLRYMAIRGEGLGNLRINKAGWQEKGKLEPEKSLFSREDTEKIIKLIGEEKGVILSTPQIQVTGIVTNGIVSTVFIAQGIVPKDDKIIQGGWADFLPIKGQKLSDDKLYGAEIAKDLAKYLNLTPGSDGVVMAPTLSGQMNALDVQINGVYDSGNDFSNDKFMRFNFYFAQSLLDTQSAERIVVLLKDWKETENMRSILLRKIKAAGIDCEIRTWNELSISFAKQKAFLDTMFAFLFSIVLVIVVMTTINTMGMAILERTREIGTLRALGLKRRGVSSLFALEGAFLGFFGSIIGILLHTCVWAIIKIYPPQYIPPGISVPVSLYVDMVPLMLFVLLLSLVLLSMFSAIIPARRAARQNIVDALGHV
ncbi:MAG: FtsX-like permease family protein [Deltaproteobacteria bacterium]|nr:FtsX-like permease family protein [Deltaproteobacteria bacterium]